MNEESLLDWIAAGAVVIVCIVAGAVAGKRIGHPVAGAAAGFLVGASINYARGCRPCRRHVAEMRAAVGGES
jgi:hypothetical protein